jgi:hypothetical protein
MKSNQVGICLLELNHRRLRGAEIKSGRDHDKTVQPIGEIDLEATSQLE